MGRKKSLKQNLLIALLAGSAALYTMPIYAATSVIANNALPELGNNSLPNNITISNPNNLTMNITQTGQNGVIKWDSFDIGGSATVNFTADKANFNTLNYVNSGAASQIYGTINADGGNIYVVNPAGVQIGNSAQINVGSLYVSSNTLDDNALTNFYNKANNDGFVLGGTSNVDIELMSLGNINAGKVTFEGDGRIVIDSERIKDEAGNDKLDYKNINITTSADNTDNIIIGYDAYDETITNGSVVGYANKNTGDAIATVTIKNETSQYTKKDGYMWVEDVEQLQAINTNLSGNYALRNSIDATETNNFGAIGNDTNAFTGKFDGIGNNIFSLSVNSTGEAAGLFGVTSGAEIRNVNIIGGSISGQNNVGALAGKATNGTVIENVLNTANVTGNGENTGGIVGSAENSTLSGLINTGTINGNSNVGGIVGSITDSVINGETYNLGAVTGNSNNVGGIAGLANNAQIGSDNFTIYNRLNIKGAYNVGGIVGSMTDTTVQNVENSGDILATGFTTENYSYHTSETIAGNLPNSATLAGSIATVADVKIANAGGIIGSASGSTINNTENTGNVSSNKDTKNDYYDAGNVGGIVGRAENTDINNAINKENEIRGAHNVGGIAGYFGSTADSTANARYEINQGQNNGGDVMATGARNAAGFVKEKIRADGTNGSDESFNIGNMGGVVGYMYGNNTYVVNSSNRGTVHSLDITTATIPEASKAANTGGVVGKLDRSDTKKLTDISGNNSANAAVSGSYNTGEVRGYTGVGGVVGMMYNGEVTRSYNVGNIKSTRSNSTSTDPLNLGGVVGDTTEVSDARALIYDVYNVGQIGDETYTTYGRHVGGVVGRLSGDLIKAYNTGNIYNGFNVNGGVVGYWFKGDIQDVFNTGNITIYQAANISNGWETGGIVGSFYGADYGSSEHMLETHNLTNAYNLGSIRVIATDSNGEIGGILGGVSRDGNNYKLAIKNVYTAGEIYTTQDNNNNIDAITYLKDSKNSDTDTKYATVENAVYIKPATTDFTDLSTKNKHSADVIEYKDRNDTDEWTEFITESKNNTSSTSDVWRVYAGTTPILNAFTPNSQGYFDQNIANENGVTVQYGTAYNPLLTIVNGNGNTVEIDWQAAGITGMAGLVVNDSDLVINGVNSSGNVLFGGTIYTDGDLTINTAKDGNIALGSASKIYASSVTIKADGNFMAYGAITATGADGNAGITITADTVENYGVIATTASGGSVTAAGVASAATNVTYNAADITNVYKDLPTVGDQYAVTTTSQATNTDVTFTGTNDVNLYYGNAEKGYINTSGDLTATSSNGDVFVDSDLNVGGDVTLTAAGEALLSLTNIGQVQAQDFISDVAQAIKGLDRTGDLSAVESKIETALEDVFTDYGITTDADKNAIVEYIYGDIANGLIVPTDTLQDQTAIRYLHNFMGSFNSAANDITLNGADTKITVDMRDTANAFDLDKYDITGGNTFVNALNNMYVNGNQNGAQEITYIEISNAEQLKDIQQYKDTHADSGILGYNFALMNDIDASYVTDYKAIASGNGQSYTGTFDGRDHRIIGLNVNNANGNAGIFDTIGTGGVVEDLRVYSSNFTSTSADGNAGAIAGVNNGRIENITTFGNEVKGGDKVGGIVGVNNANGDIDDVESTGSVIATGNKVVAGGLVGVNEANATINNSYSNSAVTTESGVTTTGGLGGVVGVNKGAVSLVDSLGVTNGGTSNNIGGVIGVNSGTLNSAYNESIVSGNDNVGGIIGENVGSYDENNKQWTGGVVSNIVNATSVTGIDDDNIEDEDDTAKNGISDYVGGLVGSNSGSVTNGRNNGTITGTNYVGGMVGSNAQGATLTNLVNDSSAAIEGENYVGGIAGTNAGTITAQNQSNLINRGSITGQNYVGGVAGENIGTIEYVKNDVNLYVKDDTKTAQYFGGVAGINGRVDTTEDETATGTITSATNEGDVVAENAQYVGGIVGWNTVNGILDGMGNSNTGRVEGATYVGGVAGKNDADITGNVDNIVTIENSGVVIAHNGGAGGIFGENTGDITYAEMSNSGIVSGTNYSGIDDVTNGTGGIIGVNSGDITYSSLKNEADGQVIGMENVGGLIGYNSGEITGGRTEVDDTDAGYYKYQIYNNGVINAGKWVDGDNSNEEGYGVIDSGEFTAATVNDNSKNIGGLIGNNAANGKLTAGYNTGAINAGSSTNVGGIAGSNAATIDQVFNTVMTENGENQTITGGTNVGGLVGNNSGTLSNAYNTTEVKGNANVGTIIGNNATNNVSNVYNTWDTENSTLISTGNSADNAYNIDSNKQTDYSRLDFNDTWKIYEGNSNPLLKVFLTNLIIKDINNEGTSLKEFLNLVYNGKEQDLNIKALIDNGFIVVPDEEALKAYHNTLIGNNLGESYLINNTDGQKTAGKHNNWLYSEQIHVNTSGEFNPNNLGYDITFANNDKGILEIDKAKLTITLDDIYRIYGQEGLKDGYEYGFSIDGLADSDKNLANDIIIEEGTIEDGALVDINNDGKVTNDVNDIDNPYKWTADVTLSDYIEQNYNILYDGGNSHVTKADLTITADNKETMPGVMPDFTGTDIQQGLVNGDSAGTYDYNLDGSVNIDVDGTYTDKIGISFDNGETYYDLENVDWSTIPGWDFLKNYDINFKPGTLIVSSELLPDIPSDWPHNRWDYLFNDAPFDRTKDFRERKAEINFVDGGMEI